MDEAPLAERSLEGPAGDVHIHDCSDGPASGVIGSEAGRTPQPPPRGPRAMASAAVAERLHIQQRTSLSSLLSLWFLRSPCARHQPSSYLRCFHVSGTIAHLLPPSLLVLLVLLLLSSSQLAMMIDASLMPSLATVSQTTTVAMTASSSMNAELIHSHSHNA